MSLMVCVVRGLRGCIVTLVSPRCVAYAHAPVHTAIYTTPTHTAYCIEIATDLFNKTDPNSLTNCTGAQEGHIVNMMRYFGYEKSNLTLAALKQYFNV